MPTPSPATDNPQLTPTAAGQTTQGAATPNKLIIPFVAASYCVPRLEPDMSASGIAFGASYSKSPEANGYLSNLFVRITASGGSGATTAAVAAADAPFNAIQTVQLFAPGNVAPILTLTGYDLYLATRFGGYGDLDPVLLPSYSGVDAGGNFEFRLRIPVQISSRSAYGALENANSKGLFGLQITFAPSSEVYTTAPNTLPTLAVEVHSENYTIPSATNDFGEQQYTAPPGLGTEQYWTEQTSGDLSGYNGYTSIRSGLLTRNLILVTRNAGARTADLPSIMDVSINNTLVRQYTPSFLLDKMAEQYGTDTALPTGVYVIPLDDDLTGKPGDGLRQKWIATTTASKMRFSGVWPTGTKLTVVTNDVATTGPWYSKLATF